MPPETQGRCLLGLRGISAGEGGLEQDVHRKVTNFTRVVTKIIGIISSTIGYLQVVK